MDSGLSYITTGDGVRIAYRFDGRAEQPVLLLSNSIGTDLHMWDGQISAFSKHFRVLRYDARGHGASGVPSAEYSLDRLGRDVLELLDALRIDEVNLLGLSLGGIVAQWIAIHAPHRIASLVLSNTAAYLGPADMWDRVIIDLLRAPDMVETAERFLKNWFPPRMLEEPAPIVNAFRQGLLATRKEGIAGSWVAVRDADLRRTIALIDCPTLVIAGENDTVTSLQHGKEIASTIPRARLHVMPAVHLSNIEHPDRFADIVLAFLLGGTSRQPEE
ncbi:alpha/beta fold hydrolase [Propionivibrio soli]|uniref:alpha/beta fold hydrolase n=1 Tax=Propionivibrio soli TaxID=2976531 RepID=UPI0021E7FEF9|nr:alpha/beta fold hydrolase [Propionivibrio soli]